MRDIDRLLKAGNQAQREKLEENQHKEGFDNLSLDSLFFMLIDEVQELDEEFCKEYSLKDIRREAADVANFCHMIILACNKELKDGS